MRWFKKREGEHIMEAGAKNFKKIFVTGTGTDVGKTVVSAGLCMAWPAHYWKPIQAGLSPSDPKTLSQFIPKKHIHPSAYTLKQALSPNQAAKKENICIKSKHINIPTPKANLVIEGAGGALVPFNDTEDMTHLMKKADCPVIIAALSGLGTLNHTFLTLRALEEKNIPILGVIMIGPFHPDNKKDIQKKTSVLLELPLLDPLTPKTLLPYFNPLPRGLLTNGSITVE